MIGVTEYLADVEACLHSPLDYPAKALFMGLRLVAHYYGRNEAVIASAALDAAGLPNFVHGYDVMAARPYYEFALGGYRVMAVAEDIADAVAILHEARRSPLLDGEHLVTQYLPWGVIGVATLALWGFILFVPYRHRWQSVGGDAAIAR
jgi:hypothetical protein